LFFFFCEQNSNLIKVCFNEKLFWTLPFIFLKKSSFLSLNIEIANPRNNYSFSLPKVSWYLAQLIKNSSLFLLLKQVNWTIFQRSSGLQRKWYQAFELKGRSWPLPFWIEIHSEVWFDIFKFFDEIQIFLNLQKFQTIIYLFLNKLESGN